MSRNAITNETLNNNNKNRVVSASGSETSVSGSTPASAIIYDAYTSIYKKKKKKKKKKNKARKKLQAFWSSNQASAAANLTQIIYLINFLLGKACQKNNDLKWILLVEK